MFYNRYARQYPIETARRIIRQSLMHQPPYGWVREPHTTTVHDWNVNPLTHPMAQYPMQTVAPWGQVPCCQAPCDVLELDEQYMVEIALPGVVLDDVQVKIEENVLTIIAKRTPTLFEERAICLQKELPQAYIARQFEFEAEIIHEQVDARLDRGILYVSVPKVEAAIRVPVSAGTMETHIQNIPKTRVTGKQHEVTVK